MGGHDPDLIHVAAQDGVGLVCTHAGHLPPRTDPLDPRYTDVVTDVVETVTRLAGRAVPAGVRRDAILIDPGHDFGKTTTHSLEITRRLDELVETGWPVLVAMSNKDFIGETLDLPVSARLAGTLAGTAIEAWLGARVFRLTTSAKYGKSSTWSPRCAENAYPQLLDAASHSPYRFPAPRAPRRGVDKFQNTLSRFEDNATTAPARRTVNAAA